MIKKTKPYKKPKRSKFGNIKCSHLGIVFDSKLERQRWIRLQECQKDGLITNLDRQVRYPLLYGDEHICDYIADFEYLRDGKIVTEDTKGVLTDVFRIKAKLFKIFYLREIQIVKKDKITTL